jgi:hypothetical protein
MKRNLIAVSLVLLFGLALTLQPLKAQVYGDFDTIRIVYNTPYVELGSDKTVISASSFGLPPNWIQDLDDGYAGATGIDIGFPFEYNGEVYSKVWICVNGFVTLTPPPFYPSKEPKGLFIQNVSYPINVIAPFWGDHRFRTDLERFNGYLPSEISYKSDLVNGVFTVQWKNLNINDQTVKSSTGSFQMRIYKSIDPYSGQGNIEFAYGQIGGNTYDPGTLVVTKNASVGIKGEFADFLNGLEYQKSDNSYDQQVARTSQRLTNEWTPSGGNEKRIRFNATIRYNVDQWWGDGDADLSKGFGHKHYNLSQNRFVTANDARVVMRAVATKVPLDSVRRRNAFHADVNHNGRYWWPSPNTLEDITWRDKYEGDNLPTGVSSIKGVFYKVNEYDAAMMMLYMSARIPDLPWLLDTIPLYGKISVNDIKASGIQFGSAQNVSNNTYTIPVYLNGYENGAIGIAFELNSNVTDVKTTSSNILTEYSNGNVVLAGIGEYDAQTPIAYVTVKATTNDLSATNVKYNDRKAEDVKMLLAGIDDLKNLSISSTPNPFTVSTIVSAQITNPGVYTVAIYDAMGSKVKTLTAGELIAGVANFVWDGSNDANQTVQSGVYIYRLIGENVSLSGKIVFNK